jgi:factor associated with neutral sphingomyelinase activation
MSKQEVTTHSRFFWETNTHSLTRSRFNLLLLEHGEYFFEDISVYWLPTPGGGDKYSRQFHHCDALKVQGRLKLCSRSIIFEPTDHRKPIVKYCFKSFNGPCKVYSVVGAQCSAEVTGFFTYQCPHTIEMMENGKIGPYRLLDHEKDIARANVLFASIHTDIQAVIKKINHLYQMYVDVDNNSTVDFLSYLAVTSTNSFDTSQLIDFHETLLIENAIPVKKIKPLTINPGCLMITDRRLYFQPAQLNNVGETVQHYDLASISKVYKRRYLLQHTCLEIILYNGSSAFFSFDSNKIRDSAHGTLLGAMNSLCKPQQRRQSLNLVKHSTLEVVMQQWQRREISNYEYLMYLNNEADRSMNDLTQYPVFPHILQDFTSEKLDLKNPETFRDLSKPIGALNPTRLENFKSRFHSMPERDDKNGIPPPFLYGTHYSTPGYVLHYLVRIAPEYMLCLQNGKFDAPDRTFLSIADSWKSCLQNPADLKELIPEFFTGSGDFLVNNDDLDLGHRHNGERLNNVDLPKWAKSPRDFIRKHAKALECDHVSNHLHEWIDLIFGYKQQGQAAVESDNVFYYLTYEGSVDLEKETNARTKRALEMQIQEFGQCPLQLFSSPHPSRNDFSTDVKINAPTSLVEDEVSAMKELTLTNSKKNSGSSRQNSIMDTAAAGKVRTETTSEGRTIAASENVGAANEGFMGSLMGVFSATSTPPLPEPPSSSKAPVTISTTSVSSTSSVVEDVSNTQAPIHSFSTVTIKSVSSAFNGHSEAITCIDIAHNNNSAVTTCSSDGLLKVLQLDSSQKGSIKISTRRSCAPSDPNPVSACCIAKNGNTVYAGCYDNIIYSYSILNACIMGRTQAHDDSVSSLSISDNGKWMISGSWDATVKVWATSDGEASVALELYDHESAVMCVAMEQSSSYAVAGGEDGSIVVWRIDPKARTSQVVFTKLISTTSRQPVTSVQWLPSNSGAAGGLRSDGFADEKFVCGTADGLVVCLDITGRLFAATRVEGVVGGSVVGVKSLRIDCRGLVWSGCDDDSVRVWNMEKGYLKELLVQRQVHDEEVTAIAISSDGSMLTTGGGGGEVKVWSIECR